MIFKIFDNWYDKALTNLNRYHKESDSFLFFHTGLSCYIPDFLCGVQVPEIDCRNGEEEKGGLQLNIKTDSALILSPPQILLVILKQ